MEKWCFLILVVFISAESRSQNFENGSGNFFVTAGYGLAGSFFVRSYDEFAPLPQYKTFYKKRFLGVSQSASVGLNLKKNWDINMGINFQQFTRKVRSRDTLSNVYINLDHTIHHRDYIWFVSANKKIDYQKSLFSFGLGGYYLRPKQEEISIYYPSFFENIERNYQNSRLEEGGVFIDFAYEYKFQSKVNLGIKTQFYYTVTAGYAESITLLPYVKIIF
jgi:hypothetical protein